MAKKGMFFNDLSEISQILFVDLYARRMFIEEYDSLGDFFTMKNPRIWYNIFRDEWCLYSQEMIVKARKFLKAETHFGNYQSPDQNHEDQINALDK
jgi:hypothetical protein